MHSKKRREINRMLENRTKRKKIQISAFFSVFFLLLFSFTNDLNNYIYFNNFGIVITLIISLFFAILCIINRSILRISELGIFAFFSLIPLLYHNANVAYYGSITTISVVQYVAIVLFFLVASNYSSWIKYAYNLMLFGSAFYAFFTILFRFTPALYRQRVIPLFGTDPSVVWTLNDLYNNGYMSGLTIHYSTNAIYLSIGVIILGCFFLLKEGFSTNRKNIFLLIFIVTALLMTAKRAHIIFSFAGLFVGYVVTQRGSIHKRIIKIIGVVLVLLIIFEVLYTTMPFAFSFLNRFTETAGAGDVSLGRFARWEEAIEIFKNNKLIGIGWDRFKYNYSSAHGMYINVHNVYLQLLCETGIVGSFIYFAMFLLFLIHSLRAYRCAQINNDYNAQYICLTAICFTVFFLLYCMTGNPLYDVEFLFPLMMCVTGAEYYYLKNIKRLGIRFKI